MSACKWAGAEKKAVDVPASPAVWIHDTPSDSFKYACRIAASSCNAACGGSTNLTSGSQIVSLNSCFQFAGLGQFVSMMCQCSSGKYPSKIDGFSAMTAVDGSTGIFSHVYKLGKIPGKVSGAGPIRLGLVILILFLHN